MPRPSLISSEHRADADRRRTQVERQHHDPEDDQPALGAHSAPGAHPSIVPVSTAAAPPPGAGAMSVPAARIPPCGTITDDQRRARLGRATCPRRSASGTVAEAVERSTCLHATEPASVYLSAVARADASCRHRPVALRRPHASSSSSPGAAPCSPSRAHSCRQSGVVPRTGGPQQPTTGWPRRCEQRSRPADEAWLARMHREILRPSPRGRPTTAELRERDPPLARRLQSNTCRSRGDVLLENPSNSCGCRTTGSRSAGNVPRNRSMPRPAFPSRKG